MAAAASSKLDATQRARAMAEACERESRTAARHPARDAASARPFTLAKGGGAALSLKPNATRPDDWRVDEATAAAARDKLAALAPHARRQQGGPSGGGVDDGLGGWGSERAAGPLLLPPSTNGEYGSHLALISAALKEEAEAETAAAAGTTGSGTSSGDGAGATTTAGPPLGQTLRLLTGSVGAAAAAGAAPIWAPDHGRKTSAVTQFASTYVAMLGHSPFSSLGRATGAAASGKGGGGGKRA